MKTGDMKAKITFQKIDGTTLIDNIEMPNWIDYTTCWAKVEWLRGKELWTAQVIHPEINVRFIARYRNDITHDMRIVHNDKIYEIIDIIDMWDKHQYLEMTCKAVVTDGNTES